MSPPESWLVRRKSTRVQTLVKSGWWSAFSAWSATRVRNANASLKSLNLTVRTSALPLSSRAQPSGISIVHSLEMRVPQEQLSRKGVNAMATQVAEKGPLGLENPMGTDGFEFVEYAAPDSELLRSLFTKMGFPEVARHKRKNVTLHRQGDCNFIINAEPNSFAEEFAAAHGPCACAMAFRVKDAKSAHARALELGATDVKSDVAEGELEIPAIEGIGGSRLYFVDKYAGRGTIYDVDFDFHPDWREREASHASHLTYIDHLPLNVNRGRMAHWADFYEKLFNFREIRYFDIEGKVTGLFSKAIDRKRVV